MGSRHSHLCPCAPAVPDSCNIAAHHDTCRALKGEDTLGLKTERREVAVCLGTNASASTPPACRKPSKACPRTCHANRYTHHPRVAFYQSIMLGYMHAQENMLPSRQAESE